MLRDKSCKQQLLTFELHTSATDDPCSEPLSDPTVDSPLVLHSQIPLYYLAVLTLLIGFNVSK